MTTRNHTVWRKSSRSTGNGSSNCVEVRCVPAGYEVRDSKLGDHSPVIALSALDFVALLTSADDGAAALEIGYAVEGIRRGEFAQETWSAELAAA